MSLKTIIAKILAKQVKATTYKWANNPLQTQQRVFENLIKQAQNTSFGKDHNFKEIKNFSDFQKRVPVRDYEALKPYVEKVVAGEKDILWPGQPLYFAKTSGTTSGAKYIPLTKASIPYHIQAARNALLLYIAHTGKANFLNGKMIFLQGSPKLETQNGIKIGRLSGIVAHYVPSYLQSNRLPSWETNCIDDWETKVNAIVEETQHQKMTLISGIPPWVQMYFEKLKEKTGKNIANLFPEFELFVYGGVNYEPYKASFENLIGKKIDSIELFPASEGFFAFQDIPNQNGMLLLLNSGIFYEFIPADDFYSDAPPRLTLEQVQLGINYVMIISTNAGLWAYNVGDTIEFTSLSPYRVIVTGRIKHFISAFGEHVIAKEVEHALKEAVKTFSETRITEFTVAPNVTPENNQLPHHEWYIEFENQPTNLDSFAQTIDHALQQQNSYYKDLIKGKVLQTLKIIALPKNTFNQYMKSEGKLGGQNKLPRLSNDRKIANAIQKIKS